jgi:hypothetical protein
MLTPTSSPTTLRRPTHTHVIPAKAWIHEWRRAVAWIPAFAGMTEVMRGVMTTTDEMTANR